MILTIIVAQRNLKKICLPNTQKVVYNILMSSVKLFIKQYWWDQIIKVQLFYFFQLRPRKKTE